MEEFSGRLISVRPNKAVYDKGEEIVLHISAEVTYLTDSPDWSGLWRTYYSVYNDIIEKVAGSNHNHSIAPWTREDYAKESFDLNCGPAWRSQKLRVRLVAMPSLVSSRYHFIDDEIVNIQVVGEPMPVYLPVEPIPEPTAPEPTAPEPTPTLWEPVVTPTPTPTPTPMPTPVVTLPGEEEKKELPGWFLPAMIGVVALIALAPRKGK